VYGANPNEGFTFINRAFGPYAWAYWVMVTCNVITPQLFWFKAVRRNTTMVWVLSLLVNVGMWFERFVIIGTSLARDFLPSSWGYYSPSVVEIFTFFGTFGVFATLFLLFIRFLPSCRWPRSRPSPRRPMPIRAGNTTRTKSQQNQNPKEPGSNPQAETDRRAERRWSIPQNSKPISHHHIPKP